MQELRSNWVASASWKMGMTCPWCPFLWDVSKGLRVEEWRKVTYTDEKLGPRRAICNEEGTREAKEGKSARSRNHVTRVKRQ
jgi:hypothetical protein